jgi:hypothetical protein
MGMRARNHLQTDRKESGGADRGGEREKSGILGREKQKFALEEAEKQRTAKERASAEEEALHVKPDVNPASRKHRGKGH